ncbi:MULTISPECIES: AAA family ATPase [unclassified Synechococcus]|uniref:AAA family ATPase n=1 Tax=unclassified Synechococcus TaxID=2626047 RepID=UPI0039B0BF33
MTTTPELAKVYTLPSAEGHEEREAKEKALGELISGADALEILKLGLEALDDISSPTERFIALQKLRDHTGLNSSKAFDQAVATLIDEQRNDKDCSLAELMQRQHDCSWGIGQFGAKGALVGIGGDKGQGKTILMYQSAIAVASGAPLFNELTVESGPAVIVQCDESDLNAKKKFLAMGANPDLPIHWMWEFNPSMIPELKKKIRRTQAKFTGIDSITTVAGGRGIKSTDPEFALFVYQLNNLAAEMGVVIFLLIHLRKPDSAKGRTSVGFDDFLGTGMLTAACSDVFGYWANKEEDAFPDQFILRCLGKRNCEAGITWDLQGCRDDYSLTFMGVQGGGPPPQRSVQ